MINLRKICLLFVEATSHFCNSLLHFTFAFLSVFLPFFLFLSAYDVCKLPPFLVVFSLGSRPLFVVSSLFNLPVLSIFGYKQSLSPSPTTHFWQLRYDLHRMARESTPPHQNGDHMSDREYTIFNRLAETMEQYVRFPPDLLPQVHVVPALFSAGMALDSTCTKPKKPTPRTRG